MFIACIVAPINPTNAAESITSAVNAINNNTNRSSITQKYNSGWAVYIDNDLFSSAETDRDYTGGLAVTLSGRRAQEFLLSTDSWLDTIDRWVRFDTLYKQSPHFQLHSFEYGFTLFTPRDTSIVEPILDDHPYASLFFIANTEQTVKPADKISYQSTLTLGILGLPVAEDVQVSLHQLTGTALPKGWENQISYGGEPTAKYTVSAQKTLSNIYRVSAIDYDIKANVEANIGYSTDINAGFSGRWGRINTPWWSFNPHQAEYINLGSPVVADRLDGSKSEFYFWAGFNIKYRFYNAILQGQFRESAVSYSRDQLESFIYEAWMGVTREFATGFNASFFVRGRTAEIKGPNARKPLWGGFIFSRSY